VPENGAAASPAPAKRPLEPAFLKRFDRLVAERIADRLEIRELAGLCGVSWKTLERTFTDFRGLTPVAHVRNMRLDAARVALDRGDVGVSEAAARFGFGSPTTFSLEYRKRFGVSPSRTRKRAALAAGD
jgi:transcriptional regulator GlxA family with amidase domain